MTQQEIQVFLAVAKMGNVSAAARSLYITQPAVSRHIRSLEAEMGCQLFERGRGRRQAELTAKGKDFIEVAHKWNLLWQETREIASREHQAILNLSSVGSVSSYLLPEVIRHFLEQNPNWRLTFHNYHSQESYDYIDQGLIDLAIISDDMYHPNVETIPAFREPMVLVASPESSFPDMVHPAQLDPSMELRCPWNPEYDLWHSFWFKSSAAPRAQLDQMSMLENFLLWADSWAIVPLSVGHAIREKCPVNLYRIDHGPPDRIIYYLLGRRRKKELTASFLSCMDTELKRCTEIESFL